MKNEFLPIGSIITVKGNDIMICGHFKKDALIEGKKYDYVCCLYPQGLGKDSILVEKSTIDKVKFVGYQDGRFVKFKNMVMGDKNE